MVRAVIDTNVIVSALISRHLGRASASYLVYQALLERRLTLVSSVVTLEELEEVLNREAIARLHHLSSDQVGELVDNLATISDLVAGDVSVVAVPDDPKDDKFVAAAIEGQADYIVSGDNHLLNLKEYHSISILTPREFVTTVLNR
jgi:putative PIN family toxin of toxin-antitoxin system